MESKPRGFEQILTAFWKLISSLVKEAPATLFVLAILLFLYYRTRMILLVRLRMSGKIKKWPYSIQYFFEVLWLERGKHEVAIVVLFLKVVEFSAITVLILYLLELIGLKIPEGIF
jgi:hypothetical protein